MTILVKLHAHTDGRSHTDLWAVTSFLEQWLSLKVRVKKFARNSPSSHANLTLQPLAWNLNKPATLQALTCLYGVHVVGRVWLGYRPCTTHSR